MFLGLDIAVLNGPSQAMSEDQVRGLARTFERASSPVWVEDAGGICLYANHAAGAKISAGQPSDAFDILDHAGRVVGRLRTRSC